MVSRNKLAWRWKIIKGFGSWVIGLDMVIMNIANSPLLLFHLQISHAFFNTYCTISTIMSEIHVCSAFSVWWLLRGDDHGAISVHRNREETQSLGWGCCTDGWVGLCCYVCTRRLPILRARLEFQQKPARNAVNLCVSFLRGLDDDQKLNLRNLSSSRRITNGTFPNCFSPSKLCVVQRGSCVEKLDESF